MKYITCARAAEKFGHVWLMLKDADKSID